MSVVSLQLANLRAHIFWLSAALLAQKKRWGKA